MSNRSVWCVLLALLFFSCIGIAEETSLAVLGQRCEAAREAKIAPLRSAAIEECVSEEKKERAECERFYADYGVGGRTAGGATRQRMFNHLPECLKLYEAEKKRDGRQ